MGSILRQLARALLRRDLALALVPMDLVLPIPRVHDLWCWERVLVDRLVGEVVGDLLING